MMKWIEETLILFLLVLSSESNEHLINGNHAVTISKEGEIHCGNNSDCPTWFFCTPENICQCGKGHYEAVLCNVKKASAAVIDGHCVTYDSDTESTYLGFCFYNLENHKHDKMNNSIYKKLPVSPKMLVNESFCTGFHRKGILCGDCEEGHSPLVFSHNLSCVKCPDGHKN